MVGVTLDSSVYIRALHLGGPAAVLIGRAKAGNLRIDLSIPILNETLRVLRDTFQWDGYSIHDMREKLERITNIVTPKEVVNVIDHDPPDNRILECAAEAKSDYIISQDKDLLRLKAYKSIPILTISEFLNMGETEAS